MLYQEWVRSFWNLGCTKTDLIEKYFKITETFYSSNLRSYHNFSHIKFMIEKIYEQYNNMSSELIDLKTNVKIEHLIIATFGHDVIYDTYTNDSVSSSADFVNYYLREMELKDEDIKIIVDLIMITDRHNILYNISIPVIIQQIFIDADNAILGSEPLRYKEYSDGIRFEYSQFPLKDYIKGRKSFIFAISSKENIFCTSYMQRIYQEMAKVNLFREIQELDNLQHP